MIASNSVLRLLVLVPHRDARLPLRAWSASLFAAGFPGAWSFPHVAPLAVVSRSLSRDTLKTLARSLREHIASSAGSCGKINGGLPLAAPFPQTFPACHPADTSTGRNGTPETSGKANAAVFGPVLDIEFPPSFFSTAGIENTIYQFSPIVLGAALTQATRLGGMGTSDEMQSGEGSPLDAVVTNSLDGVCGVGNLHECRFPTPPPPVSFRAAALANMTCRPLPQRNSGSPDDIYSLEWKIGELCWLPPIKTEKKAKGQT